MIRRARCLMTLLRALPCSRNGIGRRKCYYTSSGTLGTARNLAVRVKWARHEIASGKCLVWWVYKIPELPLPQLLHCHLSSTSFSISIFPSPFSPYHLRNSSLPQLQETLHPSWLHLQSTPPKTNTPKHLPQQTTPTPSQPILRSRPAP